MAMACAAQWLRFGDHKKLLETMMMVAIKYVAHHERLLWFLGIELEQISITF